MLCFKKKKRESKGLQALAEVSLRFAQAHTVLTETEDKLEKEIEREERAPPKSQLGRIRHTGGNLLHTKQVLLCVVFLNILDCILVLGELILDIYFLKGILERSEGASINFVVDMKSLYPQQLQYLHDTDVNVLFNEIKRANIEWSSSSHGTDQIDQTTTATTTAPTTTAPSTTTAPTMTTYVVSTASSINISMSTGTGNTTSGHGIVKRAASVTVQEKESKGNRSSYGDIQHDVFHEHTIEEELAHAFHKASITILAILTVETLLKVFFHGVEFFKRKLEVFDGFIVIASFIVDLVFLNGLSGMSIGGMVVMLAFLVPWRVIRVVNSLVVAVIDHEHFRMKLMYKQKKKVSAELKKQKDENKHLNTMIITLKRLCTTHGIPELEINKYLSLIESSIKPAKKVSRITFGLRNNKNSETSFASMGNDTVNGHCKSNGHSGQNGGNNGGSIA